MGYNVNCKQNDHGAWCKDKRVKRACYILARMCRIAEGKKCWYQDKHLPPGNPDVFGRVGNILVHPTTASPPPPPKKETR